LQARCTIPTASEKQDACTASKVCANLLVLYGLLISTLQRPLLAAAFLHEKCLSLLLDSKWLLYLRLFCCRNVLGNDLEDTDQRLNALYFALGIVELLVNRCVTAVPKDEPEESPHLIAEGRWHETRVVTSERLAAIGGLAEHTIAQKAMCVLDVWFDLDVILYGIMHAHV
jgi:hypothetical protein